MDGSQLLHRIRFIQYLQDLSRQDSGERRNLVEVLTDHTFGMTHDELRRFMLGTLAPGLEQAWKDRDTQTRRAEQYREEAEQSREEAKREREARKKAERESADKDAEIERLRKALEDSKNTKATDNRDRYGKSSRKTRHSVDKDFNKTSDRTQEKDAFDGKGGKEGSVSTEENKPNASEGKKIITEKEIEARQKRLGSIYKLTDASEKVVYPCDLTALPEGWERADERIRRKILLDAKRVIIARVIEMVRVRRKVFFIREDGSEGWKWEYSTIHISCEGETLRQDVGLCGEDDGAGDRVFDFDHIPGMIPGTSATAAFATEMLVDTQLGFMPVNRMWSVVSQYGLRISRQTLVNWQHVFADRLDKAYEGIKTLVLCDGATLFCDETWFRLHLSQMSRKVYEWIIGNKREKAVFYHYDDGSRGRKVIAELLEGRNIKAVHTDGYNAYFFLEGIGVVHVTCGAHVWRKIMDWYNATQDDDARLLLSAISSLYMIESEIRGKSEQEILDRRNSTEVTEILTRYKARLDVLMARLDRLPKIARTAVNYAASQYPKMSRWREDADYELDNNFAERSVRPVALARKNSLFHASHRGARASCVIRSVAETCKQWGRSFRDYIYEYFIGQISGRTDYENMMPWSMATLS